MRQSPVMVCARGLGRRLLLCAALLAGLLLAIPRASPQNFSPTDLQALDGQGPDFKPSLQLPPGRVPAKARGDETKPFVDMTPAELAKAVPELKHLKPAESQDMLPQILEHAGSAVAAFFDNFPNTACTERVVFDAHPSEGTGELHYENKFNYVAVAETGSAKGNLREYRTDAAGNLVQPDAKAGVVTFGFVSLSVNFHPDYQSESRFRYLGREEAEKQNTYVVAFAQRPKVARLAASVQFLGKSGMVYLQGIAWIDPESFRILRLRTDIQDPEPNTGLQTETTEVLYSEVNFAKSGETLWLPREVTVTGQLRDYLFHNQHRYSDYRLFTVQIEQKQGKPCQ